MAIMLPELLGDLDEETRDLLVVLGGLSTSDWALPTPAQGWAIRDQISHLAYFDDAATMAINDQERFRSTAAELRSLGSTFPDEIAARYRGLEPARLFEWFRRARARMLAAFARQDPKTRVPWYGPDMSLASSVTARLMETWAHGQDIVDTLGRLRQPTKRLRHIAHLGVSTFGFAFSLNGRAAPDFSVRIELLAPDGGTWSWGPAASVDLIVGSALDFCLVVTQRRHIADTNLRATGPVAAEWMSIAQAFAGAPGPGRNPVNSPKVSRRAPPTARTNVVSVRMSRTVPMSQRRPFTGIPFDQ